MSRDVVSTQRPETKRLPRFRSKNLLVILNWGPRAWYRTTRSSMTVGELRREVAKAVGRIFDGEVVGLEFVVTDSGISPLLTTSLSQLTHHPHRNVCLDVRSSPGAPLPLVNSIGEYHLRRHLRQEHFQSGIGKRLWRLIELRWPHAIFGISARFRRDFCEVTLRLNFEHYPTKPPLVELWNAQTQTAIVPSSWPHHFIRFVTTTYPEFASISAESYCSTLLGISTEVATRRKRDPSPEWDVTQDLTQLLSRASACFSRP